MCFNEVVKFIQFFINLALFTAYDNVGPTYYDFIGKITVKIDGFSICVLERFGRASEKIFSESWMDTLELYYKKRIIAFPPM